MKKVISILCIPLIILPLLCACKSGEDVTTAAGTEPVTAGTTDEVTGASDPGPVSINIGGYPLDLFGIALPSDPSETLRSAAEDMADLIERETGIKLPVTGCGDRLGHSIILGQTEADTDAVVSARAEVKYDGYALLEQDGDLYITGTSDKGTSNGVYDFLYNYLGVRFYSGVFTYFRKNDIKDVPKGQRTVFEPAFPYRNMFDIEIINGWNRYQARLQCSGTLLSGAGGPHNLGWRSLTGGPYDTQPCLSDPAVFEATLNSVCADIETWWPQYEAIGVSQNDNNTHCRCEKCAAKDEAAGSGMGSLLMFINDIADAVKERYPDKDVKILTLAYNYSTWVPDPEVVKPRDNVIVQVCTMDSTCFTHAFNDPDCEINRVMYENLVGWSKVCKNLYIWDYNYNHSNYVSSVGPDLNVLWDNMKFFRDCGVVGMFQEGAHLDTGEFCEMRAYLMSRLMWDPDITKEDFNRLWDEYMHDYYGEAGPYLREYMDLTQETAKRKGLTAWDGHTSVYTDQKVFYAPEINGEKDYTVVEKCAQLWDKALSVVCDDEIHSHIEKSALHFEMILSKFAQSAAEKRSASKYFLRLCDKYTYHYDGVIPDRGPTEGFSREIPSVGLELREAGDGTAYVTDIGTFRAGMLVIPTKYEGMPVTTVGRNAISCCSCVVEAVVPEGITKINSYAFRGCNNLETVSLPASLQYLGFAALGYAGVDGYKCGSLTTVNYAGTAEQWKQLYNAENGCQNTLAGITVHCADGDVIN